MWAAVLSAVWSAGSGEYLEIFRQEDSRLYYLSGLSQVIDDGQAASCLPLDRLCGGAGLVLIMAD